MYMDWGLKEIEKITAFCRKNGVTYFKCQDFVFKISQDAIKQKVTRNRKTPIPPIPEAIPNNAPSDADILMWSSPIAGMEEGHA